MDYKPEYEYDADEFVADWDAYVHGSEAAPNTDYAPKKHFAQKYPDPQEARYKLRRFAAATLYLQNHLSSLEEFSVVGQRLALVTLPLVLGLWRYYGAISDKHIRDEPDADSILRLAREESDHEA